MLERHSLLRWKSEMAERATAAWSAKLVTDLLLLESLKL
jgi:hypothetical protein